MMHKEYPELKNYDCLDSPLSFYAQFSRKEYADDSTQEVTGELIRIRQQHQEIVKKGEFGKQCEHQPDGPHEEQMWESLKWKYLEVVKNQAWYQIARRGASPEIKLLVASQVSKRRLVTANHKRKVRNFEPDD
jgi:hypothetical protein